LREPDIRPGSGRGIAKVRQVGIFSKPGLLKQAKRFLGGVGIYGVGVGLQFVTLVILARSLGPMDFGFYSIYTALITISAEVLALGSGDLLIKNVALRPGRFRVFYGNSLSIALLGSLPVACMLSLAIAFYQLTQAHWLIVLVVVALEVVFARVAILGRVDKVSDPQPDRRDENEAEEAIGGFVVSRG